MWTYMRSKVKWRQWQVARGDFPVRLLSVLCEEVVPGAGCRFILTAANSSFLPLRIPSLSPPLGSGFRSTWCHWAERCRFTFSEGRWVTQAVGACSRASSGNPSLCLLWLVDQKLLCVHKFKMHFLLSALCLSRGLEKRNNVVHFVPLASLSTDCCVREDTLTALWKASAVTFPHTSVSLCIFFPLRRKKKKKKTTVKFYYIHNTGIFVGILE